MTNRKIYKNKKKKNISQLCFIVFALMCPSMILHFRNCSPCVLHVKSCDHYVYRHIVTFFASFFPVSKTAAIVRVTVWELMFVCMRLQWQNYCNQNGRRPTVLIGMYIQNATISRSMHSTSFDHALLSGSQVK